MKELDIALVAVGLLVLGTGLLSRPMERFPISKPLVALALGVALSPVALRLLDAAEWHPSRDTLVHETGRLTLAIALMGVALRLPRMWMRDHWRPLSVALLLLMPLMWLASSLLVRLVLGLEWPAALLIGAILTPTDPVVASSIVTGPFAKKTLPGRLRHMLSAESGANDGLVLPLVMIGILALTKPAGEAVHEWLVSTLLREVGLGIVLGAALGYVAARALTWATEHDEMEVPSLLAFTVALAIVALGGAKLLGGSGVIAVFVAGIAFSMASRSQDRHEEERIQESFNLFFTLPAFVLLGLLLPWHEWMALGWRGVLVVALVLLLRRLPAVLLLRRALSPLRATRDALWYGWFGPLGVSAMLYAALAHERTHLAEAWSAGTLAIAASVVVHGMTSGPFTRWYGRHDQEADEEGEREKE
ncbi:MAG TPA: cation:proton antiporter [Candidatus Thermoplasmatota archaeon]|nr:cation:proton antiporter [Candidatus Thermoplasmatota archaeon]